MARSDGGMRSLVGPALADLLLLDRFERTGLVGCLLRLGAIFQLPALHGDDISRLPSRGRLSQISNLHRTHYGVDRADAGVGAFLGSNIALDFHHLFDLEPVALQRTELRLVYDVR